MGWVIFTIAAKDRDNSSHTILVYSRILIPKSFLSLGRNSIYMDSVLCSVMNLNRNNWLLTCIICKERSMRKRL